jgi:hypothetical protein
MDGKGKRNLNRANNQKNLKNQKQKGERKWKRCGRDQKVREEKKE